MDPIDGVLLGFGIFTSLYLLFAFVVAVLTLWMFIHGLIRTIKMWPEENILNIVMLILMWVAPGIGAIVYYFVCYRRT